MIRAHMASFPPRKDYMLRNIGFVLPQVDRLFLVLNEYERIPDEIAGNEKIEAVIPEDDLMDVGKFYFTPDADDWVFTMDDDLIFPPDYVETMLSYRDFMDFDKMLISLHGLVPDPSEPSGWKYYHFRKGMKAVRGVARVGTGVSMMKGCNVPSLEAMRGAEGFVDIRFAQWQRERGVLMWTVPRTRGWVKGDIPPELQKYSIFARMSANPPKALMRETRELLAMPAPENCDVRFYQWKRAQNA